jgi:hypothetical protein
MLTGDDLSSGRVSFDLGIEVIDERTKMRIEKGRHGPDVLGVVVGPADVVLEILVTPEAFIRSHRIPSD